MHVCFLLPSHGCWGLNFFCWAITPDPEVGIYDMSSTLVVDFWVDICSPPVNVSLEASIRQILEILNKWGQEFYLKAKHTSTMALALKSK